MKRLLPAFLLLSLTVISCSTSKNGFDKKEYRQSKTLCVYSGRPNPFHDGYLVLKENGYFRFYQKSWFILRVKELQSVGRYSQKEDTLYLNWLGANPREIKYYLSNKCLLDPANNIVWFVDDTTNRKLWGLARIKDK